MTRAELLQTAKPILFNTEMVRAILDGRKTVTRRVVKFPEGQTGRLPGDGSRDYLFYPGGIKYPPYQPGSILYVRETWQFLPCISCMEPEPCGLEPEQYEDSEMVAEGCYIYRADVIDPKRVSWHPSIHMPKEAARIFLRVTDVRVERLQEITADGAIAEGIDPMVLIPAVASLPDRPDVDMDKVVGELQERQERELIASSYGSLWDSTIPKAKRFRYGWDANPWIWVIEFERINPDV